MSKPKLLFLAHLLPWPLEGGGQIKSYHTLRLLSSVFEVTLLAFIRRESERASIDPLLPLCEGGIETVLLPRGKARDAALALGALMTGNSFLLRRDNSVAMRSLVAKYLVAHRFAAIHVDHLPMMQFVPPNTGDTRVVLDNHNVEYRIPQRMSERAGGGDWLVRTYAKQEWPHLRAFEQGACRRADLVLAVSEEDATALRELVPERAERIVPVPIGVDTDYFRPVARRPGSKTLLSIGTMYWPPNVDALLYFVRDIWPKVKAGCTDARLVIVGTRPVKAIRALAESDPAIEVTGSVPDVRVYGEDCAAFIVPLRSGSGMRVKILNALAMGLPVVSTRVGAEGIAVTDGENILLADGPDDFANAVLRLLREPGLGDRLGAAGQALMETHYSWEAVGAQLLTAYERHILPTATAS